MANFMLTAFPSFPINALTNAGTDGLPGQRDNRYAIPARAVKQLLDRRLS